MYLRKLFKAAIQPVNLIIGSIALIAALYFDSLWILLAGSAVYIFFIFLKLKDQTFSKVLESEEIIFEIRQLNNECEQIADGAKNSTNSEKRYRVRKVLKFKDEIVELFYKDRSRLLKQKIAKQTIELVGVYVRLIENYYSRLKDVENNNLYEIEQRIKDNEEKAKKASDIEIRQELSDVIELDIKVLSRLTEEKDELDRINTKLNFIESSISLFKQQMLTSIESEDIFNNVQNVVNEAIALDNVLNEHRKERNRI